MTLRVTRPARYVVRADPSSITIEFDENFFNNDPIAKDGTTQLDHNIASVVQEVRAALYYIGTTGTIH